MKLITFSLIIVIFKSYDGSISDNMEFNCGELLDQTIKCSIMCISLSNNSNIFLNHSLEYGEYNLSNSLVNFVGFSFPAHVSDLAPADTNMYVLLSQKFLFNTQLKGFEVFALEDGQVKIELYDSKLCPSSELCMFFSHKLMNENFIESWNLKLKSGLNRVWLPNSMQIKTASFLIIRVKSGKIGIDNSTDVFQDYALVNGKLNSGLYLRKLHRVVSLRLCVNSIIEDSFYQGSIVLFKKFPKVPITVLNIRVALGNSKVVKQANIKQQNCKCNL
ncbi:hypothetical protein BpHYR1_020028 [Brachionus plicatilis]|uniref:Uncharacterized protein n=1 Tax=Brachionus plicatilis TaxID=10195 RepID=A0A3M7PGL7_BRAPC|nr:hypothetical protein BpHYR1_020028 [Brachionus plicatilis]